MKFRLWFCCCCRGQPGTAGVAVAPKNGATHVMWTIKLNENSHYARSWGHVKNSNTICLTKIPTVRWCASAWIQQSQRKSRTEKKTHTNSVCIVWIDKHTRAAGRATNNEWPNRCVQCTYISKTRVELCLSIRFVIDKRVDKQRKRRRALTFHARRVWLLEFYHTFTYFVWVIFCFSYWAVSSSYWVRPESNSKWITIGVFVFAFPHEARTVVGPPDNYYYFQIKYYHRDDAAIIAMTLGHMDYCGARFGLKPRIAPQSHCELFVYINCNQFLCFHS